MKMMRDIHNFSAKAFKGVLFTGAQTSKKLGKALFTTSLSIFPFRDNDMLRKFDSEISAKLQQTQPKTLCPQALQLANCPKKLLFRKFVRFCESKFFNISMSRIRKMLTDVLKRRFFRLLLDWAPVSKKLWLSLLNIWPYL